MTEHLSGYQARDFEVVDYSMYRLGATGLQFRGPSGEPLELGRYFACIGAAQTFGCLVDQPFPRLLSTALGLPELNLGYGGAGPEFFDIQTSLDDYVNRSAFVVVQVMSGRSQSNSLFETRGLEFLSRRVDGARMGAFQAYSEVFSGPPLLRALPPKVVSKRVARLVARNRFRDLVDETRHAWVESYRSLLARYRVPKVLLWFSKRTPRYIEHYDSVYGVFGEYPQLVQEWMVDEIAPLCDEYVECVTSRGSPQRLFSRFTGHPTTVNPKNDRLDLGTSGEWSENRYYPSAEMCEDAALALAPTCRRLLQRRTATT